MHDDEFYLDGDALQSVASAASVVGTQIGSHSATGEPLYFDLETVPDESRLESFRLPEVPPIPAETAGSELPPISTLAAGTADQIKESLAKCVAPSSFLDDLTAEELRGKARKGVFDLIGRARQVRQEAVDAHADRLKLLSTTPEYCRIAAFGVAIGSGPVQSFVVGVDGVDEVDILEAFWDHAATCQTLVGYNIAAFDVPVICVRSCLLGIPATVRLDCSPWSHTVTDLYLRRFGARGNTSRERPGKLKELAPLYGIAVPAGDCDGSQVWGLCQTAEGRARLADYVASDVEVVRDLHRALAGYFWD